VLLLLALVTVARLSSGAKLEAAPQQASTATHGRLTARV
jgi:hypothetical protein